MEVDPFEARLEFLSLLGKLNASQHSIQKVGNFAMKNRKLHEDLYNCIIEELEQTKSLNTRMNIFYVLDSICHQSHKAGFHGYIDLIQKNLPKIIECVTPSGPKGNVNVAGTKKILELWRVRKLFSDSALDKVEKPLLARELGANAPASFDTGFTKDDILKRMDEDRERHKRIREEIWIRPSEEDPGAEFLQYWDDVSDLDEVDYEDMEAENEKYLPGYPWDLEFDRFLPSPAIFKLKPGLSAKLTESILSDTLKNNGSSSSSSDGHTPSAAKRLTSPEGTVSMAGGPAKPFTPAPTSIPVAPALPVAPSLPPLPPPLPPSLSSSGAETAAAAAGAGHSTKSNYYNHDYRDHHSHSHSHSHPHSQHQHPSHSYSASNNTNSNSNSSSHHHQHPHHHHQQQHYHSSGNSNSNSNSNSANHSRSHSSHSSSYYDHVIPTGPAADTVAAVTAVAAAAAVGPSTSSNTSSRRGSPSTFSSSHHPYSRSSQYHERMNSNSSSTHSGYANGRGGAT
ncbi:hypothetical protein BGX30_011176 [Mortierella sp. GBA39]|nr:hypothetical protein BGX30_011176 [Mortierella sp. GBA39]